MSNYRLKVDQLSPKGLALVSEFALVLYRLNGTIINVDSQDVISQIIANARASSDQRLLSVYGDLKREVQNNLLSSVSSQTADRLRQFAAREIRTQG